MIVRVRFFAAARERVDREEEAWETPPGTTVRALLDSLPERWPGLRPLRPYLRAAVNLELAAADQVLQAGDEVAVLPPLAGGSGGAVFLSDAALSVDRALDAVRGPAVGGLVVFVGLVRDHNDGHAVEWLEYEAYREMAERKLADVVASVEADFGGTRLAAMHRLGKLAVGDVAVVVAAGAAHRDTAFAAARALIDRLKETVPIWKREIGPDGVHWVGLPDPGAAR